MAQRLPASAARPEAYATASARHDSNGIKDRRLLLGGCTTILALPTAHVRMIAWHWNASLGLLTPPYSHAPSGPLAAGCTHGRVSEAEGEPGFPGRSAASLALSCTGICRTAMAQRLPASAARPEAYATASARHDSTESKTGACCWGGGCTTILALPKAHVRMLVWHWSAFPRLADSALFVCSV